MGTTVQAIEKARRLFDAADDVPALIEKLGGKLARRVQERLVERLSSDPLVQESIRREAEILRRELEGDRPTRDRAADRRADRGGVAGGGVGRSSGRRVRR